MLLALTTTGTAFGRVEVTGDGTDLWIIQPRPDNKLLVLHRGPDDEPNEYRKAYHRSGQLAAQGTASADGLLWIVDDNQTVQVIWPDPSLDVQTFYDGRTEFYLDRTEKRLPLGSTLVSLAAVGDVPWALVRIQDMDTLRQIDEESVVQTKDGTATEGDLEPPTTLPPSGLHRLLTRKARNWSKVQLPAEWPHDAASAWIVMLRTDPLPTLVAAKARPDGQVLVTFRPAKGAWNRHEHHLDGVGPLQVAAVESHLVVAQQGTEPPAHVRLWMLRLDGPTRLGTMEINELEGTSWELVPVLGPNPIGIVSWDRDQNLHLTQMNWQGQATPTTALKHRRGPTWSTAADQIVLIAVLAFATVVMFIYWRRDQGRNTLALPSNFVIAELSRRLTAGVIDLIPSFLSAFLLFDLTPFELFREHWPGQRIGSFEAMIPGAVAIGIAVIITSVSELVSAQTIGKRVAGIRVCTMEGEPPNLWQVLARNGMKALEMIAWMLLILPVIGPHRQRLGDMVARTVVVSVADTATEKAE